MTLYEALKAAGVPLDNHESDLYFKWTPEARDIYNRMRKDSGWKHPRGELFASQTDGGALWMDVFGGYDPWWEARKQGNVEAT